MMKWKKRLAMLGVAAGLALFGFSTSLTSAWASGTAASTNSAGASEDTTLETSDSGFTVKVFPGLEGYYKPGALLPIRIQVKSDKDFEGTVRVIVPSTAYSSKPSVAYESDLIISANSEKTLTVSVENTEESYQLKLQIVNEKGKVELEYPITLKTGAEYNTLVGILSDDYTALNFFDGRELSWTDTSTRTQILELTEENFPQSESGLEMLGYLVINSYDTSKLNQDQLSALTQWVRNGGVLIIGTGADYRQTLSGLPSDLVSGSVEGFTAGSIFWGYDESNILYYSEEDGLLELELDDGSWVEDTSELIWIGDRGQGRVVVSAFNLGMEPFASWSDKGDLTRHLMKTAAEGYPSTRMNTLSYGTSESTWRLESALDIMHEVKAANVSGLMILLLLFAVGSGPVLYLILKREDKREYLWIIVPILSVAVTGVVLLFTRDLRIREPQVASLTFVEANMDSGNASKTAYLSVRVPEAKITEVQLDKSLVNPRAYKAENYDVLSLSGYSTANFDYSVSLKEKSEGYLVGLYTDSTFTSTYVKAECVNSDEKDNGLQMDIQRTLTGISGSVTNNTGRPMQFVSVYNSRRYVVLGELQPGETKSFTEADNVSMTYSYIDFSQMSVGSLDQNSELYSRVAAAWDMSAEERFSYFASEEATAFAYQEGAYMDYIANDYEQKKGAMVYITKASATLAEYPGAVTVRLYDYINPYNDHFDSDGWITGDEVDVTFDLSGNMTDVYAMFRNRDDENQWGNSSNVSMYAYNWTTGEYETLFPDGTYQRIFEEGCPYINEISQMRIRYTVAGATADYSYAPDIQVIGGGY